MRISFLGFLASLSLSAHAQIQLSGNVYDVDGKPKAGVVISLAQAGLSDTTDAAGAWSLVSDVQSAAPRTFDRSRWNGRDLSLQLEKTSLVRAELFDARGMRVGERFERLLGPGSHAVRLTSREVVGGRWLRLSVDGQTRVLSGASGLSASPSEVPAPLARSAESLERLIYRFQGQILTEDILSTLIKAGIQKWIQGHLIKGNVLLDPRVNLDTVYAYFDGGRMTSVRRARVGYSPELKEFSGMFFTIRDDNNGQIAYRTWIDVLGNGLKKVGVSDTVNFNSDFGQITVPTFRLGNAIPTPVITGGSPVARNVPNTFVVDPQDAGKDILSITWTDGTGWSATGRTIQRTWPKRGELRLKVEVVDVEGNRDSAVRRIYVDTAAPKALVWNSDSAGHRTVFLDDAITITTTADPLVHSRVTLDFGDSVDGIPNLVTMSSTEALVWSHHWARTGKRIVLRMRTTTGGITVADTMKFFVKDWMTDARDGKRYPFITVGKQVWMATNLVFDTLGGLHSSYNSMGGNSGTPDSSYFTDRGYLYDWVAATGTPDSCAAVSCSSLVVADSRGICPVGWHVPSRTDWGVLRTYVASIHSTGATLDYSQVGHRLKADRDWVTGWPGEDEFGFAAKPTQYWSLDGGYFGGNAGSASSTASNFWIWSEGTDSTSYFSIMQATAYTMTFTSQTKTSRYPVRCLRNE